MDLPEVEDSPCAAVGRVLELAHGDLCASRPCVQTFVIRNACSRRPASAIAHALFAHAVVAVPRVVEERDARSMASLRQADERRRRSSARSCASRPCRRSTTRTPVRPNGRVGMSAAGFAMSGHLALTGSSRTSSLPLCSLSSALQRAYSYRMRFAHVPQRTARTVTGSEASRRDRRPPRACGLRPLPGAATSCAGAAGTTCPIRAEHHSMLVVLTHAHLDHIGVSAAACQAGLPGPRVLLQSGSQDLRAPDLG